jgi:alkylation response protein AidB-like acyl-CoA dehydrogenase
VDLNFGSEYELFSQEVRDFCIQWKGINFTDSKSSVGQNSKVTSKTLTRPEWQSILIEKGYFARSVPKKYGGYGGESDVIKSRIIASEFSKYNIPPPMGGQGY